MLDRDVLIIGGPTAACDWLVGSCFMASITYLTGDATRPDLPGRVVIAHVLSDTGAYGAGFAAAVVRRYPLARTQFQAWTQGVSSDDIEPFRLGVNQWVQIDDRIWVVNMVAQHGLRSRRNPIPLDLDALAACLTEIAFVPEILLALQMSVVMPRIGCGLAGGRWEQVEPLIQSKLIDRGLDVYVYDLPE